MSVLDDFRYTVTPLYALRASRAGVKRYAIGRKIELLAKFAHPAVGKFATAQESDKGQVKHGPGGGGTPIHYQYGYVPPKGVVILRLLI